MLIKMGSRFTREEIRRKANVGFTEKYRYNPEGTGVDPNRYAKNYQNAKGICKTCPNAIKSKLNTTTGEHCKLRFCNVW